MYPFGHREYEFVLGYCHRGMYKYCQRKHDKSFKSEVFDGKTYRDIWCLCCTKSKGGNVENKFKNEERNCMELRICECLKSKRKSGEMKPLIPMSV